MADSSQHNLGTFDLDPAILATPFGVQTKWHVISGGPSCGKTTLINLLAARGFQTAPESARLYLERELSGGRTLKEIRADLCSQQHGIKEMQLEIERGLRPAEIVFLDRAVPDILAWCRHFGLDPNEFLPACFHHRYASVFILDPLPLRLNGLRFDDQALTDLTDEWHVRDYNALGYSIVRVPVLSPEERLAFILKRLSET